MRQCCDNVRALDPGKGVVASSVTLRNGTIHDLDADPVDDRSIERVDGGGRLLTPGLIDMHAHGILGNRYDNIESIGAAAAELVRFGTTTVLLTMWPEWSPGFLEKVERAVTAGRSAVGSRMDMLYLEGPFNALPGAGGEGRAGDIGLLREILDAGAGGIRAMTASPDVTGILPVIEGMVEAGVRPFITHTRANVEQTQRAIDAGARHATHFYDVFHLPGPANAGVRPVGAVEVILADPRCTVDFVPDGIHVHPVAMRCALAAKGWRNIAVITDANSGAGRPPGIYPHGAKPFRVEVRPAGGCYVHDPGSPKHGALSGSALTLDRAIGNMQRWFSHLPEEQIWAMGTSIPAAIAGLENRGVLRKGADADLVLWDETPTGPRARRTWVRGREYTFSANP